MNVTALVAPTADEDGDRLPARRALRAVPALPDTLALSTPFGRVEFPDVDESVAALALLASGDFITDAALADFLASLDASTEYEPLEYDPTTGNDMLATVYGVAGAAPARRERLISETSPEVRRIAARLSAQVDIIEALYAAADSAGLRRFDEQLAAIDTLAKNTAYWARTELFRHLRAGMMALVDIAASHDTPEAARAHAAEWLYAQTAEERGEGIDYEAEIAFTERVYAWLQLGLSRTAAMHFALLVVAPAPAARIVTAVHRATRVLRPRWRRGEARSQAP